MLSLPKIKSKTLNSCLAFKDNINCAIWTHLCTIINEQLNLCVIKKMFGIICKYDDEEDFRIVFFFCNTKKSASSIGTPQSSHPAGKFLGITIYIVVVLISFCF